MKRFSSYITELFDKTHPWKNWQSGGLHWMYQFALAKVRGGKMVPCPIHMDQIEKFYESQGLKITGRDSNDRPIINGKEGQTHLTGAVYMVGFHTLSYHKEKYKDLLERSSLEQSDMDKVWELYFYRADSILKYNWRGRGKHGWYFDFDTNHGGTDDDLGIMGGGEAASILGTVLDISKDFVSKANPKGILIGTKPEAKDARGRIYLGMAKRSGAQVITIPYSPRQGMKHGGVIWFDKTKPFDPLAKYAKV
jgi:hypothetical protein